MRLIILALAIIISLPALAQDIRYCADQPQRDANGRILRDKAVLREFKRLHPCPSTGKQNGRCPGWAIDHVIPLACGGCDQIHNLQWLPHEIKSCSGSTCKDRWERVIYCAGTVA